MKRLLLIFLIFSACSKPDESFIEPTEDLVCVDCFDQLTHLAFLDAFCGTDQEADRFITEVRATAREKQMLLVCFKYQ